MPSSVRRRREQLEDLGLDRHVERGRRLVGDEQARLAAQRHRDHRALAHAAAELVRVVVDPALRARDADELEQLDRALLGGLARAMPRWVSIASVIWRPIVSTGLRLDSGSWKIIAIRAPRTLRSLSSGSRAGPGPAKTAEPAVTRLDTLREQAQQRQRADTLLPEPDSPTRPIVSPGSRCRTRARGPRERCGRARELDLEALHREQRRAPAAVRRHGSLARVGVTGRGRRAKPGSWTSAGYG